MVDFSITQEQKQIVGLARELGREVLYHAEIKLDRIGDAEETFQSKIFWGALAQAFELGFNRMAIPEALGGLGLDPQTTGMVWEELARWAPGFAATLMPGAVVPQLISFLAADRKEMIDRFVTPYVEDLTGRRITAWCSSEPEVGSDGSNYEDAKVHHHTRAVKEANRYVLTGAKSDFVSNGGIAHDYIVFACVDPSLGLKGSGTFVVPADSPGLSKGRALSKTGLRVLNQAPVVLEGVEIPESSLLFPYGEGYPMLHNSIVTVGNLAVGYLAVGIMRAAYEHALKHSKERVQWGRPICDHQHVSRKLFECHLAIETARAYLWKGSWLSKESFPGDLKTSLGAKIYATEMAVKHTAEMVQVLGGYGISKEYPVEKYARDALLLRIMDGTNETLMNKAALHLEAS
ncbi:MAG: acyl-CoA dehydrogenase family protein [Deltaproteobacteria bacterium]|nr:acyl-CoA dehydrogenase family protein [Deltaproteobacteria bacterium]